LGSRISRGEIRQGGGGEEKEIHEIETNSDFLRSWRNRLVKRGKRNWKRRKEGLKPIYNTDSESEGEKEDKVKHAANQSDDEGGSDASDDSYILANPVVQSTTEGFYDDYKRSDVLVDDPDWMKRYGEASSPLKKNIDDVHACDETGRIYNDVLEVRDGLGLARGGGRVVSNVSNFAFVVLGASHSIRKSPAQAKRDHRSNEGCNEDSRSRRRRCRRRWEDRRF
jgi:hypothetical protein